MGRTLHYNERDGRKNEERDHGDNSKMEMHTRSGSRSVNTDRRNGINHQRSIRMGT